MENNTTFTFHLECLPHPQVLSNNQLSLKAHLEEVIPKNLHVPELFFENLVRALVLFGDCRGIAHVCRDGGGTVLAAWLRSEMALTLEWNPTLDPLQKQIYALVDQIDFALLSLQEDPRWKYLFEDPDPSRNRLVHFQLAISGSDAYNLVASKLHRGICSKVKQLRHLDTATFNERLGGFVRPLIRIVRSIPKARVKKSIFHYKEGELDEMVWDVISALPRLSIGLDGRTSYATSTLRKFYSTWISSFYGTAADQRFLPRKSKSRRQTSIDPIDSARPDELPRTHTFRKSFHELAAEQERLEESELNCSRKDHSRRNTHRRNGGRGLSNIPAGKAPIIFTPSRTLKGSLPLTSIALIMGGLERLREVWTEAETLTPMVLVELMLHTGRRPDWLLSMNVGRRPNSPHECKKPILSSGSRQIFHVPLIHISLPSRLVVADGKGDSVCPNEAHRIHEYVNWIHRVPLPGPMSKMMNFYLQERGCLLNKFPEAAARLGCFHEWGPLFLIEKNQDLILFGGVNIQRTLSLLTAHIVETVPEHPDITASHFSRTFDAYYTSFGVRGIHRYYLSGRARHMYEMPLRYSRVSLADIAIEYSRAYVEFAKEIALEERKMGVNSISFPLRFSNEIEHHDKDFERFRGVYFGSPRVASVGVIMDIVKVLTEDLSPFKRSSLDHRQKHLYLDAITKITIVMIGLLNGLRPFEISRLKRKHLDLENNRLAVIGKSRGKKPAFRHLPILPRVSKKIQNMLDQADKEVYPGTFLFRLSSLNSKKRARFSITDLDEILVNAALRAGWYSAPLFYGLRHRFRTDMLKFGVDEPFIDYMMGHEIIGQEPHNIFSKRSLGNLDQQYQRVASELADLYGFTDLKGEP